MDTNLSHLEHADLGHALEIAPGSGGSAMSCPTMSSSVT
jgi:hypothetical protein